MNIKNVKKIYIILIFILFSLLSTIYFIYTKPIYRIQSKAIILRPNLAPILSTTPDTKNKWVWVRDGLSVFNTLKSDTTYVKYFRNNEQNNLPLTEKELRKKINETRDRIQVKYEGGDSNLYTISMNSKTPHHDIKIVNYLIQEIENIYYDLTLLNYNSALALLSNKEIFLNKIIKNSFKKERVIKFYDDLIVKLSLESELIKSQKKSLFKIIERPYIPTIPIWPNPTILILLSLLASIITILLYIHVKSKK